MQNYRSKSAVEETALEKIVNELRIANGLLFILALDARSKQKDKKAGQIMDNMIKSINGKLK